MAGSFRSRSEPLKASSPTALLAALLAAVIVSACSPQASPAPTQPGRFDPVVTGCVSVDQGECEAVVEQIVTGLPEANGRPFDVQIVLGGCPNNGLCPRTLAARTGVAYVEFADGPKALTYSIGGGLRIAGPLDSTSTDPIVPSSVHAHGAQWLPFQLGHCGLSHVVDFDGSFWVPIGQIDGDASGFISGETGKIRLLGPNLAEYAGQDGFSAHLARFPGAKRFWLCA